MTGTELEQFVIEATGAELAHVQQVLEEVREAWYK